MPQSKQKQFVLCVRNDDAEDLDLRKVYEVLPDRKARAGRLFADHRRVGRGLLYPDSYFVVIMLPAAAREAMLVGELVTGRRFNPVGGPFVFAAIVLQ